jgi:hypothetical protein
VLTYDSRDDILLQLIALVDRDSRFRGRLKCGQRLSHQDQPGDHVLRVTMVQESVAWFDDRVRKVLNLPVTVK